MGSVLTSTANVALFVLGCFLAADTANEVIAAVVLAPSPEVSAPAGATNSSPQRTWAERQIILTRNLFNSSTRSPVASQEPEPEDVEKSRLPVKLLGTFASSDDTLSRATLQDKENNETLVVAVGDQIKGKALVTRIERRRVLLTENGAPRELTLEEESPNAPSVTRRSRTPQRTARNPRPNPREALDVSRAEIEETIRNPTELLSQARVLPKFEDGEMVGLQVNSIKAGSLFEEIGLKDGDVITEFNGIAIDSPDQSTKILQEFAEADEFNVLVRGPDGSESPIHFVPRD
jgi:general secretion pathway protein C